MDGRIGWERCWNTRSAKFRSNLRRAERRLAACGRVKFIRYRPSGAPRGEDDPRWDLFNACVELATRSWQGRQSQGNTLSHEHVDEFLREAHEKALRLGCLDLNLLIVNG
ncbi:MAG: GNAT family N-acetyltransferase [Thermogutta sp.]